MANANHLGGMGVKIGMKRGGGGGGGGGDGMGGSVKADSDYFPPLQTLFAIKEKHAGRLDSHLWFFNAFAEQVGPFYY